MNLTIERIKKLIEETGLTVRELAEAADCSKSAMQRYIAGERDIPTSVINGLAAAFKVHPAYLFGWVDNKNYNPNKKEARQIMIDELKCLSDAHKELFLFAESIPEEKAARALEALKILLKD